jgi:hypothetical protein
LPSTHNPLVASSFGLQLRPEIQKNIPPFRDSYQTSFFLTTLLATTGKKGDLDKWLREPRIFEIGRKGPIDLSGEKNYQPCTGYLDDCADIHPQGVWARPRDYVSLLFWICVALGITLLYRISWTFRDIVQRALAPVLQAIRKHSLPKVGAISLAVAILIFVLVWILRTYAPPNQEPWLWTDGISIWPSELLRILALMLCIFFVMLMRKELTQSNIYLEKKYFHKEYSDDLSHDKSPGFARFVSGLKSVHSWKSSAPGDTASVDVENIWKEYREKGSFQVRILRSLPGLITFIAFAYFAVLLSGGLPVPARGDLAFVLDRVIEILSGTSVILLATFVVDASRLGHRFIQHLNGDGKPSLWPSASSYAAKWGLREDCVVYWIDVKCVADLTKTIGNFIWCPIITLLLLVASRSSLFDDYYFSYGLVIAISILLLNLFSCAFWLQSGANDMKDKAIRELDKKLRALRAGYIQNIKDLKVEREIAQLESMIEEIRNIKKGAFTPFLQQPPVMAVLAILSGGSGLPLLERLF